MASKVEGASPDVIGPTGQVVVGGGAVHVKAGIGEGAGVGCRAGTARMGSRGVSHAKGCQRYTWAAGGGESEGRRFEKGDTWGNLAGIGTNPSGDGLDPV